MNFNSLMFVLFFSVFWIMYWACFKKRLRAQNVFLLLSSFFFYGCWDWRFVFLLLFNIMVTYSCALLGSDNDPRVRKAYMVLGVSVNVLVLCLFKYLNFFSENLRYVLFFWGLQPDWFTIDVLLPMGISFYTFQSIGYLVDVYRQNIRAERDFVSFGVFISYFPQLVAGPIERASALLPQIKRTRIWDYHEAVGGMRQALWGLFKKVVIADACAPHVAKYFDAARGEETDVIMWALVSSLMFAVEIYCDFSGYCDIACGVSRLLGIKIMQNFRYPYFSRNVQDFWRSWNISLMEWFKDYVYIPLGGSRKGQFKTLRNIFIVFLLSGLWHGASWNFVMWGIYWGIIMIIWRILPFNKDKWNDTPFAIPVTVALAVVGFAIFRSATIQQAVSALLLIVPSLAVFSIVGGFVVMGYRYISPSVKVLRITAETLLVVALVVFCLRPATLELVFHGYLIVLIIVLFVVDWQSRHYDYPMEYFAVKNQLGRLAVYWLLIFLVLTNQYENVPFIYFQF